jgi:hypothetical protein
MRARIEHGYENPGTFVWTKTAYEILDAIARDCRRIVESRPDPTAVGTTDGSEASPFVGCGQLKVAVR